MSGSAQRSRGDVEVNMQESTPIDIERLESIARAARPGPWQWYGNTRSHDVYLATVHCGRVFVMDFARWGMTGAQPRFQIDHRMVTLGELGKTNHPMGPRLEVPYRRHFVGIGHPDAQHIAANSPDVTLALITRIRELEAKLAAANARGDTLSQHA